MSFPRVGQGLRHQRIRLLCRRLGQQCSATRIYEQSSTKDERPHQHSPSITFAKSRHPTDALKCCLVEDRFILTRIPCGTISTLSMWALVSSANRLARCASRNFHNDDSQRNFKNHAS